MSRARKTVDVSELRERVNTALAKTDLYISRRQDITPEQAYRLAIASILEWALHTSGNYKGFGYLDVDHTTDPPTIPDESRRVYYGK